VRGWRRRACRLRIAEVSNREDGQRHKARCPVQLHSLGELRYQVVITAIAAAEVDMRFAHAGEGRTLRQAAAALAATGALACALPAWGADAQAAVWTPKELTFVYQGHTTNYTCDALQAKMREILLQLGARPDLQVWPYGCTQTTAPDPFAGVRVKMSVLQPATADTRAPVAAQWKEVDLVANRHDPREAEFECELFDQVGKKVLPLFTTRNLKQESTCQYRAMIPGTTQLKVDVLVTEPATPSSAAR